MKQQIQFRQQVFERLLFPISRKVYDLIESHLRDMALEHPGAIEWIKDQFAAGFNKSTDFTKWMPGMESEVLYPSLNVTVLYNPGIDHKISDLKKSNEFRIAVDYNETIASEYPGNHLVLGFMRSGINQSFIVPMEYLLGVGEERILKPESYQLYAHSIVPKNDVEAFNAQTEDLVARAGQNDVVRVSGDPYSQVMYQYIGITKRTWQKRYREHLYAAQRGSQLLFHRALREEVTNIGTVEHIVERAGLTESEALDLEESEVERRTLHQVHDRGLNMIPGGRAGLKFLKNWAKRTGFESRQAVTADTAIGVLEDLQNHTLNQTRRSGRRNVTNEKLVRLWAEDLQFRIRAMTNRNDRLSIDQILLSRRLHASGWTTEKIHNTLLKKTDGRVTIGQLKRLLKGESYGSIPDVIL